jgi:hypothetical protein
MPKRKPAAVAAAPALAVPTVAAYFKQKLGSELELDASERDPKHPASPYHPEFTIETGCGVECRAAIDTAAAVIDHVSAAFGEPGREHPKGPVCRGAVVEAVRNVVLCYVYG